MMEIHCYDATELKCHNIYKIISYSACANDHEMVKRIELNEQVPYYFIKFTMIIEILNIKQNEERAEKRAEPFFSWRII